MYLHAFEFTGVVKGQNVEGNLEILSRDSTVNFNTSDKVINFIRSTGIAPNSFKWLSADRALKVKPFAGIVVYYFCFNFVEEK